ncbi:DUF1840 domain-containing protein [Vibrio parahaemolyticus]|uniref:DUF1840 domain-containing protein n=1 Tax=Vibrio parahaemolyticus TaxID=670 RepID=UPI0023E28281|nr:DUF1840 domain-containing protein [Vibrio parahaemolyticus]
MLVKFSCKNHASVIMFGDVAQEIIKMMGHSGKVPSAIFSSDIPEVLVKLNSAIEREKYETLIMLKCMKTQNLLFRLLSEPIHYLNY